MDSNCHAADSYEKYTLYFDLLHSKMTEYNILPHNTYNMDEKGFMIGVLSKSKRVFLKQLWESKEMTSALQDGSRDWVTIITAICADGRFYRLALYTPQLTARYNSLRWLKLRSTSTKLALPHLQQNEVITSLDWLGLSKFLIAAQSKKRGVEETRIFLSLTATVAT
jgi:hypothetical protein